jgi:hypothetical protein
MIERLRDIGRGHLGVGQAEAPIIGAKVDRPVGDLQQLGAAYEKGCQELGRRAQLVQLAPEGDHRRAKINAGADKPLDAGDYVLRVNGDAIYDFTIITENP